MPYIDMRKNAQAFYMLQNIMINYEDYTKKEVKAAILERKVHARVGHTFDADLKDMVRNKFMANLPVKYDHITPKCLRTKGKVYENQANTVGKGIHTNPKRFIRYP